MQAALLGDVRRPPLLLRGYANIQVALLGGVPLAVLAPFQQSRFATFSLALASFSFFKFAVATYLTVKPHVCVHIINNHK